MIVREEDIGGAQVVRRFNIGTDSVAPGTMLTRDQVLAFPVNNRQSLIDNRYIAIYPPSPIPEGGELMIYSRGFGKFDVVQGRKVNDEPLSKEEAEALVAQMAPGEEPTEPVEPPATN